MRRAALRSMKSVGSKPCASQAIRTGQSVVSKSVISPAPERPATTDAHISSRPMPSGQTTPMPVIDDARASGLIRPSAGEREHGVVAAEPEGVGDRHVHARLAGSPRARGRRRRRPRRAFSTLIVGGTRPSRIASAVSTASKPPAAPMPWPCIDLVDDTITRAARSSPTSWRIAPISTGSPARRRGAVGVDVVDLRGVQAAALERRAHRGDLPAAARVGLGEVVGVAARAVAAQLADDRRPAVEGVLEALEHEHPGALGRHEAVAVAVEGPARVLRVVVAPREGPRGVEAGHAEGGDAGLGARRPPSRRRRPGG